MDSGHIPLPPELISHFNKRGTSLSPPPRSIPIPIPIPVDEPAKPHLEEEKRMVNRRSVRKKGLRVDERWNGSDHNLRYKVDELLSKCNEQERLIRVSETSIRHKLDDELPSLLSKMMELDNEAEKVATDLLATMREVDPIVDKYHNETLKYENEQLELEKKKLMPWKEYKMKDDGLFGERTGLVVVEDWIRQIACMWQ
jgi:hypothetical protein